MSIALVVDKKSVMGVVYDPFRLELFQAIENLGSFLNSKKIHVSNAKSIKESLFVSNDYFIYWFYWINFIYGMASLS